MATYQFAGQHDTFGTYVDLATFIKAQHFCSSVAELADYLNMRPNTVRQRIKYIMRRGGAKKLRPYADLIGKKGRQVGSYRKQLDSMPDFVLCDDEVDEEVSQQLDEELNRLADDGGPVENEFAAGLN